ncbi:LOW QUALITY PROTEIN: guanine nucleotide exchange factor DBS-like [Pluvialis apricaria]
MVARAEAKPKQSQRGAVSANSRHSGAWDNIAHPLCQLVLDQPQFSSLNQVSVTTATNRRSTEISCPPKSISEVELSKKKNIKKTKGGIKIEVMHEASQGGSSRVLVMSESDENLSTRRSHMINELIETERVYVEELQSIIEGYASEMDNPNLVHLIPSALQNKKEILFGNLPEIYEFHNRIFLKEIENCIENPELLARCFLKREMLKCSKNSEGTAELEEALATMLDIIKSVNDSMHQIAITGYGGDVSELGKLLMQGSFNVWTDHKKGHNKVKDLARFKPMQRHLFLYTKMLLFCKKREENTDGHEKTASYSFKNSLKMSTVGITENVKGDNKKFEIWYNGREAVYIIQASSVELKNTWISEIRKVLTGQLEACREASQLHQRITESVYHAPMDASNASRFSRKSSSVYENKSETSNVEASNNKNRNSSPSARQKRVDASTSLNLERTALARKRFTLQGLSNRRAPPKDPESKEREVTRRFSLASSISTTVNASAVTKGPLVPAVKVKRHEIKNAFENTILAQTKCNTGSTTRPVPRSASQTGWPSRQMPSLDTFEDFEVIPSSTDELSNSSDLEEETNPNNGTNLVEGSFDSCFPDSLTLEDGDLVQFVQEGENGQWLVKKLVSEKSDWVPSSILQPAEGDSNNIIKNSNADMYNDSCSTASVESDTKESEVAKSFPAEQRAGS